MKSPVRRYFELLQAEIERDRLREEIQRANIELEYYRGLDRHGLLAPPEPPPLSAEALAAREHEVAEKMRAIIQGRGGATKAIKDRAIRQRQQGKLQEPLTRDA